MAKNSSSRKPAPQQEKPKRDDGQYGEVLFSYSYDLDDLNYLNASGLVGPGRIQQIFSVTSMALLLAIIASLYDRDHPVYPVAIAAFVGFLALSAVVSRWSQIRDRYIRSTSLAQTLDTKRHVVVTPDALVVEGPGEQVATYRLAEIKRVAQDSEGALVKLGQKRYVYIPEQAMSEPRYQALVKLLRSKR